MAGDLSELLFLAIGWFGWKSAATVFFGSVVLLFLLSVRSGTSFIPSQRPWYPCLPCRGGRQDVLWNCSRPSTSKSTRIGIYSCHYNWFLPIYDRCPGVGRFNRSMMRARVLESSSPANEVVTYLHLSRNVLSNENVRRWSMNDQ
ncbi:hypothetical protein B0J17DRAFT_677825 [Rhizoctonia solani]|nr:hypothetical protein B0J17DRAFT_677825 [Rhizoctonia solani]